MKAASLILAGSAVIGISLCAAQAQQTGAGMITEINRLDGTIVIRPGDAGTVGANVSAPSERFSVKDRAMLEPVHAGDRVTYSVSDESGVKTITKLDRER